MTELVFLLLVVGTLLILYIKGRFDERKKKTEFIRSLKDSFGGLPMASQKVPEEYRGALKGYLSRHEPRDGIDDITASDLELDEVFDRLNYTFSSVGAEYLYCRLRTPSQGRGEEDYDETVLKEIHDDENLRTSLQYAFRMLGRTGRLSIYDYIDFLDGAKEKSNLLNYLAPVLVVLALLLVLIRTEMGILAFFGVLAFNMVTYYREKKDNELFLGSFRYILRMLTFADRLKSMNLPGLEREKKIIAENTAAFEPFRRGAGILLYQTGGGNPLDVLFDYARILLHLDLIKFNTMLRHVRGHRAELDALITAFGRIESMLSVVCYRASLEQYCVPEFTGKDENYSVRELAHPLLEHPVTNDITTKGWVLITGSNASGKSTFLKACALGALMAQTIGTVCAESYRAPFYRIFSSMALRDDLGRGESYYIVEIRSLKRILDSASTDGGAPVLAFIDEVLRGTNTVERIAASSEVLMSFPGRNIRCFAATHDIELTSLLEGSYDNYHFEEEIRDGDVLFNYRLMKGRAASRNAIRLLDAIGYDRNITEAAERRAEHFIETGEWR